MATLLDAGLLSYFMPLFVFLVIFILIYALLAKTKLFGDMPALNLLAAICIAAVAVFAGTITGVVITLTPWIVFMVFVLALLFGMFAFFGVENKEIWDTIGGKTPYFVIVLIIVLIAITQTFEKQVSPFEDSNQTVVTAGTTAQPQNVRGEVIRTLTHPRLLAALFMLIVSAFAIRLITDKL